MSFQEGSNSSLRFDLFELDINNSQLRRSGIPVDLPPQALRILCLLTAHPNDLVSRQEIKDLLWPGESHGDFDSRLNFAVKKLRETLRDSAEQPRYIQTVRNAGYRFIAPVWLAEAPRLTPNNHVPEGARGQVPVNPVQDRVFRFRRWTFLTAVGALGFSALAVASFVLTPRDAPHEKGASVTPDPRSLIVVANAADGMPRIDTVSPIQPDARQRIVIQGRGFGLHVPYVHTDSPYLAIRDQTRKWAAGRIIPQNSDEVMVDVERWTGDEIVISGFSGDYGKKWWKFVEGDQVEVAVWNPQTGEGPALVHLVVTSTETQ